MGKIHCELKKRRQALKLKQEDMLLRVGMSRQQYQRLESRGNPRLDTLELVARGLRMELMLIPQEKLRDVQDVLEGRTERGGVAGLAAGSAAGEASAENDPWGDLLEDDSD